MTLHKKKMTRKRRRRKRGTSRSGDRAEKGKERRGRPPKVQKLFLVSDGNGRWKVKRERQLERRKTRADDVTGRSLAKPTSALKSLMQIINGDWVQCTQTNEETLQCEDEQTRISPRVTKKRKRKKGSGFPCNTQVRNSMHDTEVYERIQPEDDHISTSECSVMIDSDANVPASPDDDEADPDVIIVGEVQKQTPGRECYADRGRERTIDFTATSHIGAEESVDMEDCQEHASSEVSELLPQNYLGDSDTRCSEHTETQQWHQPQLPNDQWGQQPVRPPRSPSEVGQEMLNQTLAQIPLYLEQNIHRQHLQHILREMSEINHVPLPRAASPPRQDLVPSNDYRWHHPESFPERCQNRLITCQCGSAHETVLDNPAMTVDSQTLLQDSRHVLYEEGVEKERRIENASQFLKMFHGVHSEGEEPTPSEAVSLEQQMPYRQQCQYSTARQEFSEGYQFEHSTRTVKTIYTNSDPSQGYISAQAVAVDRKVIYKEEYKIIPQPQVEWNISDGCMLGDVNLDFNFSRGTLVGVNP